VFRALLLYLSTQQWLGDALERRPIGRRLVRRFVAGTTPGEALRVVSAVIARGLAAAITYLGENVTTAGDAKRAAEAYVSLVETIQSRGLDASPSLKLTHLGLDLSPDLCLDHLRLILDQGRACGTLVWIDMESSAYTERTLDLYDQVRQEFSHVGCVIQSYLRRSASDVDRLIESGATVRLCKGAYREPSSIAFPTKRAVDESYQRLADRLLSPEAMARGVYPGFATHDDRLVRYVRDLARARGLGSERFEIQMLYGVRTERHRAIRDDGLRLRVLVPFGEAWYGYFVRRLAERPANLLFFLRQLVGS
jgi:proline dehydrogenase